MIRFSFLSIVLTASLWGQLNRGTISGVISDPGGGAIIGARITAVHVATNVASHANSTGTGDFTIGQLLIGDYRVSAEAAGFKRSVRERVSLIGGGVSRIDMQLELGAVSESVTVQAKAPGVETDSSRVSTTVSTRLIEDLPLVVSGQIRNVFNLAVLAPQASSNGNLRLGGGQISSWEMEMDGVSMTVASATQQNPRAISSSVPIDAIAEFAIEITGTKAEYGRAMGQISLETKSGTNQYHGNGFEFLRNDAFDARGFFARSVPVLKQHDFGGTFGGPVHLPKLYNGRNRTFFFSSYEGFRSRQAGAPSTLTVPLPEMYNGDFNGWTQTNGTVIPIFDPASTRDAGGGKFARDVFAGNRVPLTRYSQVAKNYLSVRPASMVPNLVGPRNNFFADKGSLTFPSDKGTMRVDHQLRTNDRLSILYLNGHSSRVPVNGDPPGLPPPFTSNGGNGAESHYQLNKAIRVQWDHIFTPRLLSSFRFAIQTDGAEDSHLTADDPEARWGQRMGIKNASGEDRGLAPISMTDYTTWGGSTYSFDRGKTFHSTYDVMYSAGSHSLKGGFFFQSDRWDGGKHGSNGSFGFAQLATAIPGDQSKNSGNAFASFLLGYVGNAGVEAPRDVHQTWTHLGGYIQDDWRITRRLTINAGLRYEYTLPVSGGATATVDPNFPSDAVVGFSNFDPTVPNPGAGGRLGATVFSGNGAGRLGTDRLFDSFKGGFSPRLGLSYSLSPGTVIRAYGGRSFSALKTTHGSAHFSGFAGTASWSSQDLQVVDFPMMLDNGLPNWQRPPSLRADIDNGQTPQFWQRSDAGRPPEFLTWNLDIQRQLPFAVVATIGYNGTNGSHLPSANLTINQIDTKYLTTLGPTVLRSQINSAVARAANVPIPYPGFTGTVEQALKPFPQFINIETNQAGGERNGTSTYHAMVLKFDKRFSSGVSFLGSYVFSKFFAADSGAVDQYNRRIQRGLSGLDQTHVAKSAFTYELPFGKGKPFLSSRLTDRIAGGWNIAGFLESASGTPMSVGSGITLPKGGGGNRVFVTSYDNWRAPIAGGKFDPARDLWWSKAAFQQVPDSVLQSTIGNAAPNNPKVRSPWNFNESLSLSKSFGITEHARVVLRLESFNVLNRVRWGGPSGTYTSTDFGKVTSQANSPRQVQLGAKIVF